MSRKSTQNSVGGPALARSEAIGGQNPTKTDRIQSEGVKATFEGRYGPMSPSLKSAIFRANPIAFVLVALFAASILTGCSGTGVGPQDDPTAGHAVDLAAVQAQRALAPDEPYWSFLQAEEYWRRNQPDLARAHLDTALTINPDYGPAAALLSRIEFEAGQYETAVALLREFIARNPDAPDPLRVALALNLQALAEPERSAEILAACHDQSGSVRTAQAFVQLQGAGFESSLPVVRAVVEANPNSAANHNNHGIALLYAGQPAEARAAFLRALEIDPDLPGGLYNLAIVENFYFFDRAAGQDYFQRYQTAMGNRPAADPDDLGAILANPTGAQALLTSTEAAND